MGRFTYYTSTEKLTRADIAKENVKAIALAIAIGVGTALLLFFQLSK